MPNPAPRFLIQGQPELTRAFADLADWLEGNRPPTVLGGRNTRHYQDKDSVIITADDQGGSGDVIIPASWPWRCVNTSTAADGGQVQMNGGDGFVATLNSKVATIGSSGGTANDTQTGMPLAYPQIAVTGNGFIVGYAVPTTPATSSIPDLSELYAYYAGTVPSADTAVPATYFAWAIATISNYTAGVDGAPPTFDVSNATNYGWTTLVYCAGFLQAY